MKEEQSVVSSLATSDPATQEESDRFVKYHPFINLLILSVGPFLSTLGMAVLDSLDLMIVSYRFKKQPDSYAVQIIGIGFFVLQVCHDIGLFLAQSVIVRVSSLIGEGNRDSACQLVADAFRISVIVNMVSSIIITFIARPIMKFAGCTSNIIENSMLLVISTIAGLPLYSFFHISTGFLQAIGKAVANGLIHLAANILQTFIITPILLFAIKIDVTLCNISQPIAQSIVGIILFITIFKGKYSLKPTLQLFFNQFSPDTKRALLMSIPLIPSFINALVPSSLILRYMTNACESQTSKTDVIAVFTVILKVFMIGYALPIALSVGFLTIGTHSMSTSNYQRMLMSLSCMFLITGCFLVIFVPLMIVKPLSIMKLFLTSSSQMELAKKMLPIPMYTFPMSVCFLSLGTFFITTGKALFAFIIPFVQLFTLCVSSKVISMKFRHDPVKVLYAYNICDAITFALTLILFIITIIPLIKKAKEMKEHGPSNKALMQTTDIDKIFESRFQ